MELIDLLWLDNLTSSHIHLVVLSLVNEQGGLIMFCNLGSNLVFLLWYWLQWSSTMSEIESFSTVKLHVNKVVLMHNSGYEYLSHSLFLWVYKGRAEKERVWVYKWNKGSVSPRRLCAPVWLSDRSSVWKMLCFSTRLFQAPSVSN